MNPYETFNRSFFEESNLLSDSFKYVDDIVVYRFRQRKVARIILLTDKPKLHCVGYLVQITDYDDDLCSSQSFYFQNLGEMTKLPLLKTKNAQTKQNGAIDVFLVIMEYLHQHH